MPIPADAIPVHVATTPQAHEAGLFNQARLNQLAHDLRTPLTVILGYTELLKGADPREDQEQGLDALLSAGANLGRVVEGILQAVAGEFGVQDCELPMTAMYTAAPDGGPVAELIGHEQGSPLELEVGEPTLLAMVDAQRAALAGLRKAADTDFLTGIGNRRAIEQRLEAEWRRAQRHDRPLTVLMIDIDGFKTINDCHGHPGGDAVLAEVARRLAGAVRMEDEVGRVGGDEFMIVCPETNERSARTIARKLRRAVSLTPVDVDGSAADVHVSVGFASMAASPTSVRALVGAADARLYRAKAQRRRASGHSAA